MRTAACTQADVGERDPLPVLLQPWPWLQAASFIRENRPTLAEEDQYLRLRVLQGSFLLLVASGLIFSLNWTSLHRFYRERLAKAYIEPVPGWGRSLPLSDLDNSAEGGPYHLVSGTLNLLGYLRSEERHWPFLFSRHYCGSDVTGYVPTAAYLRPMFDDLAQVTAISGAAVSPAQANSLWLTLLMTLANLRLGQWLANPRNLARPWWHRLLGLLPPAQAALLPLSFSFLRDAELRRRCFVSDGGHSENLGLWPLLKRRCKLMIVADASQDPEHTFDDFLKMCRRMRLYHGVKIVALKADRPDEAPPLDLDPLRLLTDLTCRRHCFMGRVLYPVDFMGQGEGEGFLIYLKPSMTRDEENDLWRHFRYRPPFPHDPTVNQVFDQDTVESYRQLGHHIGTMLGRRLPDDLSTSPVRRSARQLFDDVLRSVSG
jgi:hypothetical protein